MDENNYVLADYGEGENLDIKEKNSDSENF